jgi:WD40 repeat protein
LISASWDKTARVWDPAEGRQIAVLEMGEGVTTAGISPDGTRAATSGQSLQIWDVEKGERLHTISVPGAQPARISFSSSGGAVAAGWSDGYARVYDTAKGTLIAELGAKGAAVNTVVFYAGDSRLATGDAAGVVRVFVLADGQRQFASDTGGRAINHLAVSGDRIAVGADQLYLVDAHRGGVVVGLAPHADTIWDLDWTPDGRRLATCAMGGVIKVLSAGGALSGQAITSGIQR